MIGFLSILILIFLLFGLTVLIVLKTKGKADYDNIEPNRQSVEGLVEIIKQEFNDLSRSSLDERSMSPILYERNLKMRTQLMYSLKRCVYGSINDKQYVKDVIYDILNKKYVDEGNIDDIVNFNSPALLTHADMFDIILYDYKKKYDKEAFSKLVQTYSLDSLKTMQSGAQGYEISSEDILKIYYEEDIHLSYSDKLEIISQKIYQKYKGFSVIDEIRDMDVDGVSGGVSGITKDNVSNMMSESFMSRVPKNYESVWVFYKGKSIYLSFLSFGTYDELKRVCQNIYKYNNQGMLSRNIGYKVNDMLDGSRIVVVRPDFAESWAFFVRKFNSKHIKLENLFVESGSEHLISLIKFLAKGACITSITGAQASGKTTLLMAMVGHIYETLTLRVQEMAFELNLRKLYPFRNILSFRETPTISGQEGLDLQKKTDGSVLIIGEVATDAVAAWMIQTAQVASAFTIFTHHSKTVKDLILSLRNSLLKCDIFRNEKIAQEQVVNVLDFDIHLSRDYSGKRYVSRITEIIAVEEKEELPDAYKGEKLEDALVYFMDTMREYYKRVTDDKSHVERDIIVYDGEKYVLKNKISKERIEKMKSAMIQEDKKEFDRFNRLFDLIEKSDSHDHAKVFKLKTISEYSNSEEYSDSVKHSDVAKHSDGMYSDGAKYSDGAEYSENTEYMESTLYMEEGDVDEKLESLMNHYKDEREHLLEAYDIYDIEENEQ